MKEIGKVKRAMAFSALGLLVFIVAICIGSAYIHSSYEKPIITRIQSFKGKTSKELIDAVGPPLREMGKSEVSSALTSASSRLNFHKALVYQSARKTIIVFLAKDDSILEVATFGT